MCWGQFANPAAAPSAYGTPLLSRSDSQHSSGSPEGSDYLDETLLGHITDDAILGNLMDGELDILECLFKEEPVAAEAVGTMKECSAETAGLPSNQAATLAFYTAKAADTTSDHSVQTPDEHDQQGVSSSDNEVKQVDALRAQLLGGQQQHAAQHMAAQQMAAAAAAAQMQMQMNPQMGMLPNVAAMQMLAANQGMLNFPFAPQVLMQPNFGFKMGASACKSGTENDEAVERIKKKRRESAQRSRARKNQYMKALEVENKGLRTENSMLRECLLGYERQYCLKMPDIPHTQMAVRPLPDSFMHDMCD
jgi:hypothetical protein